MSDGVARDDRTYIRLHDGMPDHPKIEGLSDKAFRVLIETWCWSSRQHADGCMSAKQWTKRAKPKVRRELEQAGLIKVVGTEAQVHDYLKHQNSAAEIAEQKQNRKHGGKYGSHQRWHVKEGRYDPACEYCTAPDPPTTDSNPNGSTHRSPNDEPNDFRYPDADTDTEISTHLGKAAPEPDAAANAPPGVTRPNSADAKRLVSRVISADFPAATRSNLAIQTAGLLAQYDESTLVTALQAWRERTGIGPGVLPSLVADVVKNRSPNPQRNGHANGHHPSTTDARVLAAQALKTHPRTELEGGQT